MTRIASASFFVLLGLLGLLFGVGMLVISRSQLPPNIAMMAAGGFAVTVVLIQYAISPWLIDRIMTIRWTNTMELGPDTDAWMKATCQTFKINQPRFGIIEDVGPNAFTYGNGDWNARVVVTRGVINALSPDELRAVLAHELGHIKHRDFIFMTLVQAIVLAMYAVFRMSRMRIGRDSLAIGLVSWLAYQAAFYISLLLSRLREYMADYASAQILRSGNPLASALVKISFGLADTSGTARQAAHIPARRVPLRPATATSSMAATPTNVPEPSVYDYDAPRKDISGLGSRGDISPELLSKVQAVQSEADRRQSEPLLELLGHRTSSSPQPATTKGSAKLNASSLGAFGIAGQSSMLAAVSWMSASGGIDTKNFGLAARWELYNPWAKIAEILSTHPLTARRIQALMKLNSLWGVQSQFDLSEVQPGRYPRFVGDLLVMALPWIFAGCALAATTNLPMGSSPMRMIGIVLLALFTGSLIKHVLIYPGSPVRAKVIGLLGELNVSHVNPRPVVVEGTFTGYVDAGFFWAHNFVLQDNTGFIATSYLQPLGAQYLIGMFKSGQSLGRPVRVEGWYRRFGNPVLEISSFEFLDDKKRHRAYYSMFLTALYLLGAVLAGVLIVLK